MKFVSEFSKEELALLKALKPGDKFVVNKEEYSYTRKDGSVGKGWKLSSLAEESTYTPRVKKEWKGNNNNMNKSTYGSLGQQVGNCVSNAILSLGAGKTIEQYKERMLELAEAGNWLRSKLESGNVSATNTNSINTASNNNNNNKSTATALDTIDVPEDPWNDLADIEF